VLGSERERALGDAIAASIRSNGVRNLCGDGPAISLAHSGELVACAIAPAGQIGVDVEAPRARRRTVEIAERYFSSRESDWLHGKPQDRFYMLWVLKEAYLKATGAGLGGGLAALEGSVEPPHIRMRARDRDEQPALALYRVGPAFLGIATIGYRFTDVATTCFERAPSGTVLGIHRIASS
jgi:hypothetical protein